jgi:hypothetical protein
MPPPTLAANSRWRQDTVLCAYRRCPFGCQRFSVQLEKLCWTTAASARDFEGRSALHSAALSGAPNRVQQVGWYAGGPHCPPEQHGSEHCAVRLRRCAAVHSGTASLSFLNLL